jgi:outer membrane lipoprotein-sorting protein
MRSWTACLCASALLLSGPQDATPARPAAQQAAPARPADASALFAAFARVEGFEARFEEEKHLALLAAPLASRGRLYYLRPGYLLRRVESPEASRLLITPDELKMSGRDGDERIDLRQSDDVRLFVTSIVQVLLGDEAGLKATYGVEFTADAADSAGWTLALTPLGPPVSHLMKSLVLRGSGFVVSSIELLDANGDRTVTRVLEADVTRHFSREEQSELFEIRPR